MDKYVDLPEGKTCADCAHVKSCRMWEDILPENTECRFRMGEIHFKQREIRSEN